MAKSERISEALRPKFDAITAKTDAFCQQHLDDEYRALVRKAVAALCRKRPPPLLKGGEDTWAAGAVHAIGWANFAFDKSSEPHCSASDIQAFFGIAPSTLQGKSKQIRDFLDIHHFAHQWLLARRIEESPTVWMVMVNGYIVDIRSMPLELRQMAFEKGLIPYVPGAKPSE